MFIIRQIVLTLILIIIREVRGRPARGRTPALEAAADPGGGRRRRGRRPARCFVIPTLNICLLTTSHVLEPG